MYTTLMIRFGELNTKGKNKKISTCKIYRYKIKALRFPKGISQRFLFGNFTNVELEIIMMPF